jgi:hypothetical protein
MLIKKADICIIIVLLLSSIAVMFPIASADPDETYVSVINPETGNSTFTLAPETPVNTTVVANITVTNVTDLIGYQVNLTWNPSLLKIASSSDVYLPSGHIFEGLNPLWMPLNINNTVGYLGASCSRGFDVSETFTGSGTMFQVNFTTAKNGTADPVCCGITLSDKGPFPTQLRKGPGEPIDFTPENGYYCIPEFPTIALPMLFLIATLIAFTFGKKAWSRKQ